MTNTVDDPEGRVSNKGTTHPLLQQWWANAKLHICHFPPTLHGVEEKNTITSGGGGFIRAQGGYLCLFPQSHYLIFGKIKAIKNIRISPFSVTAEGTGTTEGYWWSPGLTYLIYAEFNSSAPPVSEHPVYGQTDQIYPYNFKQVYIKVSLRKQMESNRVVSIALLFHILDVRSGIEGVCVV